MAKIGLIALATFAAISTLGCNLGESQPLPSPTGSTQPVTNQPINSKLVAANTQFGFKLYSELLKRNKSENVFVSPTSVAIALSMTYNGADGVTQAEMAKALQVQGVTIAQLNQANANLKVSLEGADPKVELAIANSLWADQKFPVNPTFIKDNQTFYRAEVKNLSFADPSAASTINAWVNQNTRGKISQILDRVSPDQAMILINATYFKGQWSDRFDPQQTQERPFFLTPTNSKQHPMMRQKGTYRYAETPQFQAISLPYGKGRLSFYVFLPKSNSSLAALHQNLTAANWQTWMPSFSQQEGTIQLPKFKLSYESELKETLSALGMKSAFDPTTANFSKLSSTPTKIDRVKHKTFVEVNEEGTEAAAVTGVGITSTSARIEPKPFEMVVNRPFFCTIRDNQTGEILFMGSIVNPQL
jgi:serpin B